MGGKRLKFPTRQKYVPPVPKKEETDEDDKPISEEEHQKRMELLKSLGLIKDEEEKANREA